MTSGAAAAGSSTTRFAADFAPAAREQWLALVDKAIKGADFEKKLVSRTADGLRIEPIYLREQTVAAAVPGHAPFTRGVRTAVEGLGWEIHQRVSATAASEANAQILDELDCGSNGIVLVVEAPGQAGIRIVTPADMASALSGMRLDLAPVQLRAGLAGAAAARSLIAALPKLGYKPGSARAFLNLDPVGALATWGTLANPLEEVLAEAMALAKDVHAKEPQLYTVNVDSTPYHEAGASEGQELAALAATLVVYLRTFEAAGVSPSAAVAQMAFTVSAGADQFLTIAKLRAARRLVWRIAEASGAGTAASAMHFTAQSSQRMMARRDPWTNMLRTTLACAGASLGGADAVCLLPFTSALGEPDAFARRIARNIQIVLQEESGLGRTLDPAGGSWYVERLTADLAAKAWSLFQDIEAKGGIIAALGTGTLQDEIAATAKARAQAIATGRAALTGVSAFPQLGDDGVKVEPLRQPPPLKGKSILRPLAIHREAEPFEALRDAADAYAARTGKPPQVFLASLGEVIEHTNRSTWIKNYLGAGGIESLTSDGYKSAQDAAAAFKSSGASAACICSTDALYAVHAQATAKALKAAGCKLVLMAGKPGDHETAFKAAGVDQFLSAGADAVATLKGLQEQLGVGA